MCKTGPTVIPAHEDAREDMAATPERFENGLAEAEPHGRVLHHKRHDALSLLEVAYRAGLYVPEHSHAPAGICLVLDGAFKERVSGRDWVWQRGMASFHPPAASHRDEFCFGPARILGVVLPPPWLQDHFGGVSMPARSVQAGAVAAASAAAIYREFQLNDGCSAMAIEGLVIQFMAEIVRSHQGTSVRRVAPAWIQRTLELLHDRFRDGLRLAAVAAEVKVHPVHLARTFKLSVGTTMGSYLRRLRIDWARQQLANSDLPLVEIALLAGYSSQGHFSFAFREAAGTTPAQYRAAFRRRSETISPRGARVTPKLRPQGSTPEMAGWRER